MSVFQMETEEIERLYRTIQNFPSDAEKAINSVFHNEAPELVEETIKLLMPMSGRTWAGKAPPARTSKSLSKETANLSFTVRSNGKYNYLYFPDDGTNTRRHVGNQQFFKRGGEMRQHEIVDLCINRLITNFKK